MKNNTIIEQSSVKDRIKQFIKFKKTSQGAFEKRCGLSNGYINNIRKSIKSEKYDETIAIQFPELNKMWILHNEGEMLKGENYTQTPDATPLNLEEMNIMMVPLVSKFAYAGYLDNMGDDEYEEDLPKVAFTSDRENKGDYLAFEVKGDSMDNGLSNSILEGDILLARNVRQDFWTSKLHINKWNFIIVHRERGILIKRITEHDTSTHEIVLHSLNDYYEDVKVHLKDIQAIYNVVDIKRKPII